MKKNRYFWIVAILGVIFDQITKYIITQTFTLCETWPLWSGVFHFTYIVNPGAAFSLFSPDTHEYCQYPTERVYWLGLLSLIVSLGLMLWARFGEKMRMTEQLGYGFILAGALGNGIDRFLFGYVVDFLDFRLINFPVFNLADTFINIGIVFLLIVTFSSSSK